MSDYAAIEKEARIFTEECVTNNRIDPALFAQYDIKRGLRNHDGTGVMVGVTQIGNVYGYYMQNGERVPMPGKMVYRGINVEDLILGFTSEGRFGYEETAFLLLMGHLPTREELDGFILFERYHDEANIETVLRTTGLERAERLFEHQYQVYWVH